MVHAEAPFQPGVSGASLQRFSTVMKSIGIMPQLQCFGIAPAAEARIDTLFRLDTGRKNAIIPLDGIAPARLPCPGNDDKFKTVFFSRGQYHPGTVIHPQTLVDTAFQITGTDFRRRTECENTPVFNQRRQRKSFIQFVITDSSLDRRDRRMSVPVFRLFRRLHQKPQRRLQPDFFFRRISQLHLPAKRALLKLELMDGLRIFINLRHDNPAGANSDRFRFRFHGQDGFAVAQLKNPTVTERDTINLLQGKRFFLELPFDGKHRIGRR